MASESTIELRGFYKILRQLGFRRVHQHRECVIYARQHPSTGVEVNVQLWSDGQHRVSTMHQYRHGSYVSGPYAHSCRTPTDFTTEQGLYEAIDAEYAKALTCMTEGYDG